MEESSLAAGPGPCPKCVLMCSGLLEKGFFFFFFLNVLERKIVTKIENTHGEERENQLSR